MSEGKPNPKRLSELAETDAILRLLKGVQRQKDGAHKSGGVAPALSPEEPAPRPPMTAFVGDDAGQSIEAPATTAAETVHRAEPIVPPVIEADSVVSPPQSVMTSPPLQFEPDRLTTAMPMHAFVESYAAPTLTDFESAFEDGEQTTEPEGQTTECAIGQPVSDSEHRPPPSIQKVEPVLLPIGALTFAELLARINWRNRLEDVQPLPFIGEPDPPGYAESVEAVLAAFQWDDE
jgi:hypothetical protein